MTGAELRAALDELGLTRAEFSRMCGVQWKTVQRWISGELAVPRYAVTIVDLKRELRAAA